MSTYDKSNFGKISPLLLGNLGLCDKYGTPLEEDNNIVVGVVTDADTSIESQYSSPFENSNPESRLPTLMGMLQSGDWVQTFDSALGSAFGNADGQGFLSDDTKEKLNSLEGRSNFTKVNSTQIYVATQPIRLNVSLFFEAWTNAKKEVEQQIELLQKWALPVELSDQSIVGNLAENQSLNSLFPSKVPPFVYFKYANKRYAPLHLESVSAPLVTPFDRSGNRIAVEVNLSLMTKCAWDQRDISNLYNFI